LTNAYDQTPFDGAPCAPSHPDSVGAIARLFGLTAPAASACRVLELGCGAGDNLIPIAAAFPGSTFVGLDLSEVQLETGRTTSAALNLRNLSLRHADIAALPSDLGTFDFIIVQGVFSWVEPPVQEALFAAARALLTEQGVAFVSYLALPGASAGQALSETLKWWVRDEREPGRRVDQARHFANHLAMNLSPRAPHAAATRKLLGQLGGLPDSHLLHDYLSGTRAPLSLSSFVSRAETHGLQYLGDAQFHTMLGGELESDVLDEVRAGAHSQAAFEQHLDFLLHRPFRTSLLCRAERTLDRSLASERLNGLFLSSRCKPVEGEERFTFESPSGELFNAGSELVGKAFERLVAAWPSQVELEVLCADQSAEERATLGANLIAALGAGQLEVGTTDRGIAHAASARPLGFSFARAQAAAGSRWATNLWHQRVEIEPALCTTLATLDGTHGADAGQLNALAAAAFLVRSP
jgi:SAM-dependent methyltransferase